MAKILIRPADQGDVNFIIHSWLKSYHSSDCAKHIHKSIYHPQQRLIIEKLLRSNYVDIACNPDDTSQIYGYICHGDTDCVKTLHYMYVKYPFRRMGIAKQLLLSAIPEDVTNVIYTHFTTPGNELAKKYNFIFHPYVKYQGETDEK